jgi:hypothetical protein
VLLLIHTFSQRHQSKSGSSKDKTWALPFLCSIRVAPKTASIYHNYGIIDPADCHSSDPGFRYLSLFRYTYY